MQRLKQGSKGDEVRAWQRFLTGQGIAVGLVDGKFGPKTHDGTKEFQRRQGLEIDGIVGPLTMGRAMLLGFDPLEPDRDRRHDGPNFPPLPANLRSLTSSERERLFGRFRFEPAPTRTNPEGIRILDDFVSKNVVRVKLPQLAGVPGIPSSGLAFHKKGEEALRSLVDAWERAGLLRLILSCAGTFNPRFVRGTTDRLSNHSWATAIDINASFNAFGARPALVGQRGSVRELVPLANQHGFFWGGHFATKSDGMHLELVSL